MSPAEPSSSNLPAPTSSREARQPIRQGAYTIYDLMIVRFLIAGALGLGVVLLYRTQLRLLRRNQVLLAASLGVVGYLGYSACIAAGIIFGGPVLTPASSRHS